MSATARVDVAAVGLDGARQRRGRRARRVASRRRSARRRRSSRPNGLTVHHGMPEPRRVVAHVGEGAVATPRPGRSAPSPPPAAAAQDASRNSSLVATRSCGPGADPLGVAAPATCVPAGSRSTSSSISSTSTGASDSMPSTGDALGELVEHLGQLGVRLAPARAARVAHLVGEQQLAARRRPQPCSADLERALVGDREVADLLDLVAPELHPQRVLLGGREDVDDAAADRELAALLDQVDPGVRRVGEPSDDVVEVDLVARRAARPARGRRARLTCGCSTRADRRDDDLQRAVGRVVGAGVARAGAARRAGGRRCRCAG